MTLTVWLLSPNTRYLVVKLENAQTIKPIYDSLGHHIGFLVNEERHVFNLTINSFKVSL